MKLQTFFEKFNQFADAPDAVAKVLVVSPNGATYDSPGQRPGTTIPPTSPALKGRANATRLDTMQPFRWVALAGLPDLMPAMGPRALPWADIARPVGAEEWSANGALYDSPGQRPGTNGATNVSPGQRPGQISSKDSKP